MLVPLVLIGLALAGLGALAETAPAQPNKTATVASLAADVAALDARIAEKVNSYGDATAALDSVRTAVRENQQALEVAQFNLATTKSALADRVVAFYKQQTPGMIDVLMQSSDLDAVVTQADAVRRLAANDSRLIDELGRYSLEVESRSVKLNADKQSLTRLVSSLKGDVAEIRAALAERQRLLAGAQADLVAAKAASRQTRSTSAVTPPTTAEGSGVWWPQIQTAAAANGISADGLYRLMMIESGGSATASNSGRWLGLFQYARTTWSDSWNPYRSAGIFDGPAQIKATALAIRLGHGPGWWGPSYSWAFQTK